MPDRDDGEVAGEREVAGSGTARQAAIFRLISSLTAVHGYAQLIERCIRAETPDRDRLAEMSEHLQRQLVNFEEELLALIRALPPE